MKDIINKTSNFINALMDFELHSTERDH